MQVDLQTGHSYQLFSLTLSKSGGRYHHPIISGDFLAMTFTKKQRMTVVINWRKRKYVAFDGSGDTEIFAVGHFLIGPKTI